MVINHMKDSKLLTKLFYKDNLKMYFSLVLKGIQTIRIKLILIFNKYFWRYMIRI